MKRLIAALSTVFFASMVLATQIEIDFTKDFYESLIDGNTQTDWIPVAGHPEMKMRITATKGGLLNWAEKGKSIPGYDSDGIGIGDDEITESGQEIKVEFDRLVYIHEAELLDLFYEQDNDLQTQLVLDGYFEAGYYNMGDGQDNTHFFALNHEESLIGTQSTSPGSFGIFNLNIQSERTNDIFFGSYDLQSFAGDNDYALAKLTVSAVPEASVSMLFGFSIFGMLGMLKIRNRKKLLSKIN